MKLITKRKWFAGAIALVTLMAGMTWVQLGSASGTSTNPDTIQYTQTTGNNGTYTLYVPGDGTKSTKQSLTSGGGCATPSPSGAPILGFSGLYYTPPTSSSPPYSGTATTVPVGAYKSRTGVCSVPQAWSIEQNESLTFFVGPNPLVAGRLFTRAQIVLEREDKTSAPPPVTGRLVARLGGTIVDSSQTFSIAAQNLTTMADTLSVPSGFDSVEIRVESPSAGSVSVVGPQSTFTLASEICGGQTVNTTSSDGTVTTGQITATFRLDAPPTVCKSYTFLGATVADHTIKFLGQNLGLHITATFDWGNTLPACAASPTSQGTMPQCPPTQVDNGDGNGFQDQVFCDAASHTAAEVIAGHQPIWCTTARNVNYISDPGGSGQTVSHMTEEWDGYGDVAFRPR